MKLKAHSSVIGENRILFSNNCHNESHCLLCIQHICMKHNVTLENLWHHSRWRFLSWKAFTQYNTHWLRQGAWRSTKQYLNNLLSKRDYNHNHQQWLCHPALLSTMSSTYPWHYPIPVPIPLIAIKCLFIAWWHQWFGPDAEELMLAIKRK